MPIVEPGSITMRVDGSEIGGRAACNIYGGTLDIDGNQITISALSMTEMACQEDLMASEAAYMAAIGGVDTAERTDDRLVLAGTDVELHYLLEPPIADASLTGTPWRLDSLITGEAVSSTMSDDATLELAEDGTISGFTGCRSFSGRYEVTGSELEIHNLVNDDRRCAAELQGTGRPRPRSAGPAAHRCDRRHPTHADHSRRGSRPGLYDRAAGMRPLGLEGPDGCPDGHAGALR